MGKLGIVVCCSGLVMGCGKDGGKKDEAATSTSQAATETPQGEAVAEQGSQPSETWDRAAFCQTAFDTLTVGRLAGAEDVSSAELRREAPPGAAECKVEWGGTHYASVLVDCRETALDPAQWQAQLKQLAGDKEGNAYRDLQIGKGGAYIKLAMSIGDSYQAVVVHDQEPCYIKVDVFADKDLAEPLVAHVLKKLSADNRPRE